MSKKMNGLITGITGALDSAASSGCAEFSIGNAKVKIDSRGISIVLNEIDLPPVTLRLHRPSVDASCLGYVLVADPGPKDIAIMDEGTGFKVIGCL